MADESHDHPKVKKHVFQPTIFHVVFALVVGVLVGWGIWGHKK